MLGKILAGKAAMQRRVQMLVALRAAAKEHRASSLAGAGSSMGGAAPSGSVLALSSGGAGSVAGMVRKGLRSG